MRSAATAVAVLVASGSAHAGEPETLVAQGQELARRGQIGDAVGFYAVGAATLITGFVIQQRSPESPRITAHIGGGGAGLAMEWSR